MKLFMIFRIPSVLVINSAFNRMVIGSTNFNSSLTFAVTSVHVISSLWTETIISSTTCKISNYSTLVFFNHHHHYHHVVSPARISLTLSRYFSLSFIASGRSSGIHHVSLHSCCMYIRAGRPAFARPDMGVHRSTSLMSSSLLLQQCPVCLVHLTWLVFVMGCRWQYSWCLVECCHYDLLNIARNILV